MVAAGKGCAGQGRKTWRECVEEDKTRLLLKEEEEQDRVGWRSGVLGDRATRASADIKHN